MNKKELKQFKAILQEYQARLRGDVAHLTSGALDGGAESKSPTHMAELGTSAFEQDFSLGVMERDQNLLEEIQSALSRIEEGAYGSCERCLEQGKAPSRSVIPKTRLKVIPWTRNCVSCEREVESLAY